MILVCDDMPEMRTLICELATDLGYDCKMVRNGKSAIRACREHFYNLVFMDEKLDDMNGKDAIQKIRALPAPNCSPYIVLLTGFPTQADANVAPHEDGIDLHMVKPQATTEIEKVMREVMKGFIQ